MSIEVKTLKTQLNFQKTTPTFKKLINKYHMKKKAQEKHNQKYLLQNLESKIQELENDERENDYIISEVRRNAQLSQEILYSFGTKVLNHIDEIKKLNVTSKLDKSKFFLPNTEKYAYQLTDFHNFRNRSLNSKYKQDKIINLPKIIVKKRNIDSYENKKIIDFDLLNNKNNSLIDNKSQKQNKNLKLELSLDMKEKNNDIINYIDPINKKDFPQNITLLSVKSLYTTQRDTNNSKINNFRKRNIILDSSYFNSLDKIENTFVKVAKKQERYFDNHKYGYDAFKLKYNYLKKKYFN